MSARRKARISAKKKAEAVGGTGTLTTKTGTGTGTGTGPGSPAHPPTAAFVVSATAANVGPRPNPTGDPPKTLLLAVARHAIDPAVALIDSTVARHVIDPRMSSAPDEENATPTARPNKEGDASTE